MSDAQWQRVREVLEQALELPREARAEFLDRACDGDREVRREVESLLAEERFLEATDGGDRTSSSGQGGSR